MKIKRSVGGLVLSLLIAAPVMADPAVGQWVTVDDEDGTQKSVVDIRVNDKGELQGTVVKVLKKDDQGKVCSECPDDFKDQPIEGLTFMWGLEKDGEGEWKSGHILDPQSGKIYKSKLNVADDGESLEVRGYIGVSWIGRSQTWLKYEAPADQTAATAEVPVEATVETSVKASVEAPFEESTDTSTANVE